METLLGAEPITSSLATSLSGASFVGEPIRISPDDLGLDAQLIQIEISDVPSECLCPRSVAEYRLASCLMKLNCESRVAWRERTMRSETEQQALVASVGEVQWPEIAGLDVEHSIHLVLQAWE